MHLRIAEQLKIFILLRLKDRMTSQFVEYSGSSKK